MSISVVKSEWHQVEKRYGAVIDEDVINDVYPDATVEEVEEVMRQLEEGELDVESFLQDAYDQNVDIEWDWLDEDDWWTDRKGGYEVTYELGDESSWHAPETPPEPTHKCTKCKWKGQSYDAEWVWPDDEDASEGKQVCPYCESDVELTPEGLVKEEEREKRMAEIDAMFADDEDELEEDVLSLEESLDELKREFEQMVDDATEEPKKKKKK